MVGMPLDTQPSEIWDARDASCRAVPPDAEPASFEPLHLFGEFAPGIVHDMRNMLQIVASSSNGLKRSIGAGSEDAERTERFFQAIEGALDRASRLAESLLHLGRSHPSAAPQSLDPQARLAAAAELARHALSRGQQLRVAASADLWPVEADAAEFDAALLNLVVNARDAMPGGGDVSLRARNVRSAGGPDHARGEYVRVSVTDTGTGMDARTFRRAGEPFFTTKGLKGTGLGLLRVRRFIERCGGFLRMRSAPGRGTAIALYWPRAAAIRARFSERALMV